MKTLKKLSLSILLLGNLLPTIVVGYSSGAPRKTCFSMVPGHPNTARQNSQPPYEIWPSSAGKRVRLILGSSEGLPYQGFFIVARDLDNGRYVGEFSNLPRLTKHVQCSEGFNNAVTHVSKEDKRNMEFDWQAPDDYEGTVVFNSTFLQDYATYWIGVESPRITVLKSSAVVDTSAPQMKSPRTTTPPYYRPTPLNIDYGQDSFYDGCGVTKICFGAPSGCEREGNCKAAVAVVVRGERYFFEMQAQGARYVAVGLSEDSKMGDDSVVECVDEGGRVGLYMSWNTGRRNRRIQTPEGAIQMESSSIQDDTISCTFSRDKRTFIEGREFDLIRTPYKLLLASGTGADSSNIGFHDIVYLPSSESRLLSDVGEIKAASNILFRIHGALMLASWIGTASVGILLARYYRQTWVSSQCCGKDHWFVWHRFFMILTWLMTLAGFIVIFVQLGRWSDETIHASLGLATTILCFIQPFMAALRPHPGAPRRSLFNWAHWFVGNAAHICGIIAIFYGFGLGIRSNLTPDWVIWIVVAYVVFHIVTHLFLTFTGCISDRQGSQRVNSFPMKDMHSRGSMSHPDARRDAPHSGLRKLVFGIYFVVIAIFAAVLIVIVVLAPIEDTWKTWMNKI